MTKLWQVASTCTLSRDALDTGHTTTPSLPATPSSPATPSTTRSSLVRVPVLSKQQISTFPAKGMRNGSVQKTPSLERDKREVLTAKLSSIGSSGGTTEVRIRVHSRNSLYLFLLGSRVPLIHT